MSTKVINLSYLSGGGNFTMSMDLSTGKFKSRELGDIPSQMKDILEKNHNYEFKNLVYHDSKYSNMTEASLIVEVEG